MPFVLIKPFNIPKNTHFMIFIDDNNSGDDQVVKGYEVKHVPLLKIVKSHHFNK